MLRAPSIVALTLFTHFARRNSSWHFIVGISVQIQEFFDFFKLELTDFAKRCFEVMDFDQAKGSVKSLHYGEFFVSMWNFCTLTHETLCKFTFDLYDQDGSGELSEKEVFHMVRMMRPSSSSKDADRETKKMMALMVRRSERAKAGVTSRSDALFAKKARGAKRAVIVFYS